MSLPFLKWPGGKRWLVQGYRDAFLPVSGTYFEPFLGAGAAFFLTQPERALLSDSNGELINLYAHVRDEPRRVRAALRRYQARHCEDFYYVERARTYNCDFKRAMQFLYLNRTCFNGIYRVNRNGEFNVPIGTKTNVFMEGDDFNNTSQALHHAKLRHCDFTVAIGNAGGGDFVYADPPYTVKHNMNGFVKYNDKLFQWSDQEKLHEDLLKAHERGAKVLVSNADHESIRSMYQDNWHQYVVSRASVISAGRQHRGATTELLISNFEIRWGSEARYARSMVAEGQVQTSR